MTNEEMLVWLDETERRVREHIADFTKDLEALGHLRGMIASTLPARVVESAAAVLSKVNSALPKEDGRQSPNTKIWRPKAEEWIKGQGGEFTSDFMIKCMAAQFPAADMGELKTFVWNFIAALVKFGSVKKDGTRKNYRYTNVQFTSRTQSATVAPLQELTGRTVEDDVAVNQNRIGPADEPFCEECGGQSTHKIGCRAEDAPPIETPAASMDDLERRVGESVADFYARKRGMFLVKPKTK